MAEAVKVRIFVWLLFVSLISGLSGCGGASSGSGTDTPTTQSSARYIDLIASSPQLNSAGTTSITLTALVKDSKNRALVGETVEFNATSGSLTVTSETTDDAGQATATLGTSGNKANRTITVTATAGSVSTKMDIAVIGTTIDISGQDGLPYNTSAPYTITLKDSAGTGIPDQKVTISSVYNTLSAASITTNSNGQGTVTLSATDSVGHNDTLSAGAFGATGTKTVVVNPVTFTFTSPLNAATININTSTAVTVNYTKSSVPQAGVSILFQSSRGQLSASSASTDAAGNATVQIQSSTVGEATITASITSGPSAQRQVEFVATTPATIAVQASPTVIAINAGAGTTQQSMITAVVRDSSNNPVKNKKVNFTIIEDGSAGRLSPDTGTTNSAGAASVYYIAGGLSSGTNGVKVQASVEGMTLTETASLTVSGVEMFIEFGTGPVIYSATTEVYEKRFAVVVTDSAGRGISGATVTPRLTPIAYVKGYCSRELGVIQCYNTLEFSHPNPPLSPYADPLLPAIYCGNEDFAHWPDTYRISNAILDAGEDYNGNGVLNPGNIASVSSAITTNENGLATVSIFYPKEYAVWVYVRLDITVLASGTEGRAHRIYQLRYDINDYTTVLPPDSPFGLSNTCADAR